MTTQTCTQTSPPASAVSHQDSRNGRSLLERYRVVRNFSESVCEPLEIEDYVIQSMPDVSPTRWHLAHTTWFFETMVLSRAVPDYKPFHPDFVHLFNSYYNSIGRQFPRPRRGMLSRPTMREIYRYRAHVDRQMYDLLSREGDGAARRWGRLIEVGLHHEQQHQELMLTDIKHVFFSNPLYPVYTPEKAHPIRGATPMGWVKMKGGLCSIGHEGKGFAYDNEMPRHRVYVEPVELADRLVANGEYLRFMRDGGYERPELWLSEGWAAVTEQGWRAPLYWIQINDTWWHFTLAGLRKACDEEPVCHVSYFEADAYARWAECRLPTEAQWELAAPEETSGGNFIESGAFHPRPAENAGDGGMAQMYGDAWEWTASPYTAYPGYRPPDGALGEYNGKFMCNQMVLRGGSCVTPASHIRRTYRNFFPPASRWQFSSFRLAR